MRALTKEELQNKYKTEGDLLSKIKSVQGHSFVEFDVNNRLVHSKNKGVLGHIVEEGIFGYPINSDPHADFDYLNLELKTTGVRQNKNKSISAKERLPLDTLNYGNVASQKFEESDMWIKSKGLLLVLYNYIRGVDYGDMPIIKGLVHRFSDEDKAIIENDYNIIANKIKSGNADTLSESDTMYLGACTAGTDSYDLVVDPVSGKSVKRRKFCIKNSYMTSIFRSKVSAKEVEHLFSMKDLAHKTFEMALETNLKPYFGMTESQIEKKFGIGSKAKSKFERYIAAMLGIKKQVNKTDEFVKANIQLKTIRVEQNGSIKENMSFPAFHFKDIVEQEWDDSEFREMLDTKKFLFAIFKKEGKEYVFKGIKFWHIPVEILDTKGKEVFDKLKEVLLSGNIVAGFKTDKKGKVSRVTNFPGMKFNGFIHIRPHGINANDVDELPVEESTLHTMFYTKQCFWLNNSYINYVINND